MTIDITSKLFILLAAYTLLHAAVYIWYQSRKPPGDDSAAASENIGTIGTPRRRMASGIHRSPSRHQTFLLSAMLLAALMLAGIVVFSAVP